MTKIVAISDTHNQHLKVKLPEGEVLVHAGDATSMGTIQEVNNFLMWMGAQPFLHKLFVPGNHDWLFERQPELAKQMCEDNGITLLIDKHVIIDGLNFYGAPWQPEFCGWAFNVSRGQKLADIWSRIPSDTDVLITHGPPMYILDELQYANGVKNGQHVGCADLKHIVDHIKPKIHIFGHIHCEYGKVELLDTKYYNASILDDMYMYANDPWEIEI